MTFQPDKEGADSAARFWLLSSVFWMTIGPFLGLLISTQFIWPDLWATTLDPLGLNFGELRAVHTNSVIYAVFGMGAFGSIMYIVPRLVDQNLHSEKLGVFTGYAWNAVIVLDALLLLGAEYLTGSPFLNAILGRQPFEYAEAPLLLDVLVVVAVLAVIYNLLRTLRKREEAKLYVSVWYLVGGLFMTAVTYLVGNFVPGYIVGGASGMIVNGWWIHNAVGLFVTPLGVGIAYYVIPKASKTPLYSHRLSIIGFWTLVWVYPITGVHHYMQAPIPTWLNELAIVTSILLLIPVFAAVTNFFMTPGGNWKRWTESYPLRFAMVGTVYYLLTCLQGPFHTSNTVNYYIHFTEWVASHAHLAALGAFVFYVTALMYYAFPRITGRQFYSRRLASWHFWLLTIGLLAFWVTFTISGIVMAVGTNTLGATVHEMNNAVVSMRAARTFFGAWIVVGFWLFAYNVYQTVVRGKGQPLEQESDEVPAKYGENERTGGVAVEA